MTRKMQSLAVCVVQAAADNRKRIIWPSHRGVALASQNASSAPDTQADPPGALNLDSSSALETTQIVLLCAQRSECIFYYRSPPLRYLVRRCRRRRCIHLFFLPCRLLVLHAFVIPPAPAAAAHTRACAAIFMVQCNQQRDHLVSAREREAPLFSYSQGFLFPNCIIWGVVPQQRHGNFSHSSFCSLHATLSHPQKYVAIFFWSKCSVNAFLKVKSGGGGVIDYLQLQGGEWTCSDKYVDLEILFDIVLIFRFFELPLADKISIQRTNCKFIYQAYFH